MEEQAEKLRREHANFRRIFSEWKYIFDKSKLYLNKEN